jgi:hypothetical protein
MLLMPNRFWLCRLALGPQDQVTVQATAIVHIRLYWHQNTLNLLRQIQQGLHPRSSIQVRA